MGEHQSPSGHGKMKILLRVSSSGMWRCVGLLRTIASIFSERGTRATRRNIPEDGILHSHRSENIKSYTVLTGWTL
jgi:hypothetical protein